MTEAIGLRELRHRTGAVVDGLNGIVSITDRGTVVAYLVSARPNSAADPNLESLAATAPRSAAILALVAGGPVDGDTAAFVEAARSRDRDLERAWE